MHHLQPGVRKVEIMNDIPVKLESLRPDQCRSVPLSQLVAVIDMGRSLIRREGVIASLDGFYQRPFGQDTYFTLQGLLCARQDFGSSYVKMSMLIDAARSYLQYMNEDGELPHEVGTREQGYPFEIDERTGFGKHFSSVAATGLAILTLDQILALEPGDTALTEEFREPLRCMAGWAICNVKEYGGLIGYGRDESGRAPGEREVSEHTWQDGQFSILDEQGEVPPRPMCTVLEQGLYWAALNRVADRLGESDPVTSGAARDAADIIRHNFNSQFVYVREKEPAIARAIDGAGKQIRTMNIDELIVLGYTFWGTTILDEKNVRWVGPIVRRLMSQLFTPLGGLRNQGHGSPVRDRKVYHGPPSIWPFANGLAIRSLAHVLSPLVANQDPTLSKEFYAYALTIAKACAGMLLGFGSPVETAQISDDHRLARYQERRPNDEQFTSSCIQAWTVGWGHWIYRFLKRNHVTQISVPIAAPVAEGDVDAHPPLTLAA
jgi:glycogen debranching enzyme